MNVTNWYVTIVDDLAAMSESVKMDWGISTQIADAVIYGVTGAECVSVVTSIVKKLYLITAASLNFEWYIIP